VRKERARDENMVSRIGKCMAETERKTKSRNRKEKSK
jgi:hypothetical protein